MGNEEEKLALLRRFATLDYLIATPFPVPEQFHTTVVEGYGKKKMPVALRSAVEATVGIRNMFEEVFVEMEKQLPAQTKLCLGPNPLVCITPVLGDDDGRLKAVTSPQVRF